MTSVLDDVLGEDPFAFLLTISNNAMRLLSIGQNLAILRPI
eukprot:COSAG06_NODE_1171_length_10418_cov_8.441216_2_plen_41_part_00